MNTDQFNDRMESATTALNMVAKKLEGATNAEGLYPVIDFTAFFAEFDNIVAGLRRSRDGETVKTPEPETEVKPLIQLINTGGIAR